MINNANIFARFYLTVFENKHTFVKRIYTAYSHCDAQQSEVLFLPSV